ncbi:MAG: serine/threonine protein kinase, partial [Cyanobacteria bacterium]|nr:serine/threonine protein kinase [Cyanobacteriota bacterium]
MSKDTVKGMDQPTSAPHICDTCGKVVRPVIEGSMTSWIFADGRCQCALHLRITQGLARLTDIPPELGDNYEILELVGQGGMGCVYKVKDLSNDQILAVKVMHRALASDAHALARFEKEARACLSFSHPGLVSVHESGVTKSGEPFLVMDFVDGITLEALVEREDVSTERILQLMTNVAEALAGAHSAGVVHRDLKPGNIMITNIDGQEQVKVLDFGIARILPTGLDHTQSLTATGDVFGSPLYMSP